MLIFEERENQSTQRKTSRRKERTNMKLNTHSWYWSQNLSVSHWSEVSALTTAPSFLAPRCAGHWWNYIVHEKCRLSLYVVYWTPTVMQKYDRNDRTCFHPSGDWYSVLLCRQKKASIITLMWKISYLIENYKAITMAFITPDQNWEIRYVQTELIYYIKMFRKYGYILIKWTYIQRRCYTGEATYNTSQLEYTLLLGSA